MPVYFCLIWNEFIYHLYFLNRRLKMLKHIKDNFSSILFVLITLVGSISFSPLVFSADKSNQICGQQEQYIVRQLASEQEDNICDVYKGQVVLIVNTASRCTYTDQYDELEKLYAEYKERGLVVIGFPSNDFGNQEPGNEQKIKNFCRLTYGVKFPMYTKTRVKGKDADPLYKKLSEVSGQTPQWNFHKYLINRDGVLIGSYRSSVSPYNSKIIQNIEQQL